MRGRGDEGTEMRKKGARREEVNRKQGEVDTHGETEGGRKRRRE